MKSSPNLEVPTRRVLAFLAAAALGASPLAARTTATAVVCTEVVERTPQGEGQEFAADVGELYCFSELKKGQGSVTHVWFYSDREVARIELPVKGKRYRTWSQKRIPSSWTGPWRVEVLASDGSPLAKAEFSVRP